jgi:hypothetical protein
MTKRPVRYGIPDLELPLTNGGTLNPGDFAGHELVVVFLPLDPVLSASEIEAYECHEAQFSECDAWLITVGDDTAAACEGKSCMANDPDGDAWTAFAELPGSGGLNRADGAVFIFGRGGALQRVLAGPDHAPDVAKEITRRS